MTNLLSLRNQVITTMGLSIGRYTLPSGGTVDALTCLPDPELGYSAPISGVNVTGIEVVIRQLAVQSSGMYGKPMFKQNFEILLKQWDNNASLLSVIESLLNSLGEKYIIEKAVHQLGTAENLEIARILLTTHYYCN